MYLPGKDNSRFLYKREVISTLLKDFHNDNKEEFFNLLNTLFHQEHVRKDFTYYLETVIELLKELGYQFEYLTHDIKVQVSPGIKYCVSPNISLSGNGLYKNFLVEDIEYITFFSDTIYYIKFQMKADEGILIKLKG